MQFNFDTNQSPDISQPAAWILTRNALPELLSRYVGVPASQITFDRGAFERPMLSCNNSPVDFSTSHCDRLTAIAITPVGRIGIDIEHEAPTDWRSVARDCCTNNELEWMRSARDFLQLWTAKEACGKALGLGTNLDLRGIELTSGPGEADRPTGEAGVCALTIRRIQHSTDLARCWQLFQRQHMDLIISVALVR